MSFIKYSLAIVFLCFSLSSYSQDENERFILFKLYKNAIFDLGATQATRTVTVSNFTPAIAWGKGSNYHEIQITSLNFQSRAQSFLYSGGAEYTYNHRFSDDEDSKFHFFFGGGFGMGFSTKNSSIETANSLFVPTIGKFINLNLVAIPRVTYEIRRNVNLELSLSYNFLDYENSKQTAEDPSVPVNARTNVYNELQFFPGKFSLRVAGIVRF
ncbi:MAG: hypothetical protein ABF242_01270 [Flavobacteriales bacterium]